jgi:glutamine amidotransferase
MVGIIDYGVGNLFSLRSSFAAIGVEAVISGDPAVLAKADRLVLPGVGAFGDAARKLRQNGLDEFVRQQAAAGKPLLGICLGMQLLFEKSYEYGIHTGLGLLQGQVVPMAGRIPGTLKVPHMGWNALKLEKESRLLEDGAYVYFVHSYYAIHCQSSLAATAEYGIPITAAVEQGNIFGCQFHPEKSGEAGLAILKRFSQI